MNECFRIIHQNIQTGFYTGTDDQSIEYGVSMSKLIDDVNSHSEKREDEHED